MDPYDFRMGGSYGSATRMNAKGRSGTAPNKAKIRRVILVSEFVEKIFQSP